MEVKEGKAKFVKTRITGFSKRHRVGLHNWVKRGQKESMSRRI